MQESRGRAGRRSAARARGRRAEFLRLPWTALTPGDRARAQVRPRDRRDFRRARVDPAGIFSGRRYVLFRGDASDDEKMWSAPWEYLPRSRSSPVGACFCAGGVSRGVRRVTVVGGLMAVDIALTWV